MHKVLRLPRNCSRSPAAPKRAPALPRQSKCCACHAKVAPNAQSAAPATQLQREPSGAQTRTQVLPRQSKCCACHAKVAPAASKYCCARQKYLQMHKVLRLPRNCSRSPTAPKVRAAMQTSQTVKVLPLPRKSSSRCTKCCACHAIAAGAQRRPSARQALPRQSKCCACHAK